MNFQLFRKMTYGREFGRIGRHYFMAQRFRMLYSGTEEGIFVGSWYDLSKNLKSIRQFKELSQAQFAKELGVAKSTLQKLENEEDVSPATLKHIAEYLEVPASALFTDNERFESDLLALRFLLGEEMLVQMPPEKQAAFLRSTRTFLDALEAYWKGAAQDGLGNKAVLPERDPELQELPHDSGRRQPGGGGPGEPAPGDEGSLPDGSETV